MSYLKTPRAYRQQGRKGTWCCDGTVLLPDGRRVRVVIKRATAREAVRSAAMRRWLMMKRRMRMRRRWR